MPHRLADLSDRAGARKLLTGLALGMPRLKKFWADAACRDKDLADWRRQQGDGWELESSNEHTPGARGFSVQPRRWVVERSFAWLLWNRRVAKDDESPRTMNAKCRPARRSSRSPQSE